MTCPSCSAPVPARGVVCAYCGTRLDVDLQGWSHLRPCGLSDRLSCPDGHGPLESLELPVGDGAGPGGDGAAADGDGAAIQLGRCASCLGLFLPIGALERLLDQAVAPVWSVDHQLLSTLTETPRAESAPVRYRPCPSCGELMNRSLHGKRSGVVVDRCRDHGLWLDAGELRQLLEWARAGGALLDQERREQEALEQQERIQAEREQLAGLQGERLAAESVQRLLEPDRVDLLTLLIRLARELV